MILQVKNPTLKVIEDFITKWEAIHASNSDAVKAHHTKANHVTGKPTGMPKHFGKSVKASLPTPKVMVLPGKRKCLCCGKGHAHKDCSFKDATCNICYSGSAHAKAGKKKELQRQQCTVHMTTRVSGN